jgi:hypothetical protein
VRLVQGRRIVLASWRVLAREPEVVAVRRLAALAVGAVALLLASGVALWLVLVVAATLAAGAVVLASRARRLVGWAVAAAVVSTARGQLEERLGARGRVVSSIAGGAFSAVSLLALPVLVFRDRGAVEGVTRSARLVRATWRQPEV